MYDSSMMKRVLIIEDNKDLQQIYKVYFEKAGLLTYISDDGMKWITDILKHKPDIILLDLMMPTMDGYEVLETIKKQSSIITPVVVCSTISQKKDIDKVYELWADLFIRKWEFTWEEVVKKALQILR